MEGDWGDFDALGAIAEPDGAVLQSELEIHGAFGEGGEGLALERGDLPSVEVAGSGEGGGDAFPPDGGAGVEAIDADLVDASGGAEKAFFVGLPDFDPVRDLSS